MTYLGYRNPLRRLANAVRGLGRRPKPAAERRPVLVVGHRGAPRHAPENTVASFAEAIALGADAVEADVCVTRDGRFVLWHDCRPEDKAALARQIGSERYAYEPDVPPLGSPWRRPVGELTLEELREHYAYVPSDEEDGSERIAFDLLDDLFAWTSEETRLRLVCLDVKLGEKETRETRSLVAAVREARQSGRIPAQVEIAVLCPLRETLQAALTETRREPPGPGLHVFADFEFPGALDFARRYGAENVSFGVSRRLRADLRHELTGVLAARAAGRIGKVIVWTVQEEDQMRELVAMGVDGILTDDPARLRRIVSGRASSARKRAR